MIGVKMRKKRMRYLNNGGERDEREGSGTPSISKHSLARVL